MAMEVNGSAILCALATNPSAFAMNEGQINNLATQTLIMKLKDKSADINSIRSIAKVIGPHDFGIIVDILIQKDVISIAKRLDPKNTDLKNADDTSIREHVASIASGAVEPRIPSPQPPKTPKAPPKPKSPKMGEVMKSKALKARPTSKRT